MEEPDVTPVVMLSQQQKNHLLGVLKHSDHLLAEIEHVIDASGPRPLFAPHVFDVGPQEAREIRDGIAELRQRMAAILEKSGVKVPAPHIGALHAVATTLDYIDIELEELQPRAMRAYGEISSHGKRHLESTVNDLRKIIRRILAHVRRSKA